MAVRNAEGSNPGVEINQAPFDLGDTPPFPDDTINQSYDADAVERYRRTLQLTEHVLARFASGYAGKTSPIQLFWHSFDIAHARFSGRRAPALEGADPVTAEAYSHELIALAGGRGDERRTPYPAFYSYTAPEPPALREQPLHPDAARWQDTGNGSLALLAYDDARAADDPAATLLDFFRSDYRAGTLTAGWDGDER